MWVLNAEEMESSFKIDLTDVLWWMSIKDAYKLGVPIIVNFFLKRCISIAVGGKPFHVAHKQD